MPGLFQLLPQGVIWYPTLVVLFVGAFATLYREVRRRRPRRASRGEEAEPVVSVAALIRRSRTDAMAMLELERRALTALMRLHDISAYSVPNCRLLATRYPEGRVRAAIDEHLENLHTEPGSRGSPYRGTLPPRVAVILKEVERKVEA